MRFVRTKTTYEQVRVLGTQQAADHLEQKRQTELNDVDTAVSTQRFLQTQR
jgi:hypothetical protein